MDQLQPRGSHNPPPHGVKRKRNRVPVACFNCRTHKTKCDGIKPVCSTCAVNGEECQYSSKGISTRPATVVVNQEYLSSLERRLSRIEQRESLSSAGDATSPYTAMSVLPPTPASQSLPFYNSNSINNNNVANTPVMQDHPISSAHLHLSTTPPNGGAIVVSADPNVFMGGVSFTQLILNAMNGRTVGLQAQSLNSGRDELFPYVHDDLYQVPNNAIQLLRQFFDCRHRLSPIFHEPTVWALFNAAMISEPPERPNYRYTFAIMNMIFAICSSHRLSDVDANPASSRRYYETGMALLQPTLLQHWSIEKVQALLLGTRYLQSSNSPDECWNVLGLAIRIAYGLELYRPPPEEDGFNLKEVKKRVWNACFTLDKLLSMIYGRPSAIVSSGCTCPLPEDLDDDCIFVDRILHSTPKRSSNMSFSIEVAKLYRILESATQLSDIESSSGEVLAQAVMSLDERYQKWYSDLPPQLILDGTNDHEQPLILALRANMVRILIHRQSLAMALEGLSTSENSKRISDSMKSTILQYSRNVCVNAAMETINIVALRHQQSQKATGPSWFNLYYLFNAILILVSHVVDPAYHNDKLTLARLDLALNMIKSMSSDHTFAQRAYSFLQQLISYMDKSLSIGRANIDIAAPTNVRPAMAAHVRLGGQETPAFSEEASDLFALFDFTQDLTEHLGTHLETFESIGSGMWSWSND